MKKQQGFLALTLVIIMLIAGFVGSGVAYRFTGSGRAVGHDVQSTTAWNLAETGLNTRLYQFENNIVFPCPVSATSAGSNCVLSAWSTPTNLGRGQFQSMVMNYTGPTWSGSYAPAAPTTTSKAAISSSSREQVVPVSNISNFAPIGQIVLGTSPISYLNYTGTSDSDCVCGSSNSCFTGVIYTGSSTIPAGTSVRQNQTVLSAALSPSSSPQKITVANISNFAPMGQLIIGTQSINYTGISTNSTRCGGGASCFVGVSYPSGSTFPVNSRVSQNQVIIQGRGGVPSLASPQGERFVAAPVFTPSGSSGSDGGCVGSDCGGCGNPGGGTVGGCSEMSN